MQQELTQNQNPVQERHFWSLSQIALASYIGGPLAGSYLLGRNYKESELPVIAKKCYAWGIIGTILIYAILLLIPEDFIEKLPSISIPLAYATTIIFFAQCQKKIIEERFGKENKRYSFLRCLGLSLSFFLIQAPIVILIAYLYIVVH